MTSDATQFLNLRVIIVLFQLIITCLKPNITIKKKKSKQNQKNKQQKRRGKCSKLTIQKPE